MKAKHVLIATGTRETPRAARLVGRLASEGSMNTGALQHMFYLSQQAFERPVSSAVNWCLSALLTCRHLGIRPVAMLEEKPRISRNARGLIARFAFGVPVRTSTSSFHESARRLRRLKVTPWQARTHAVTA